MAVPVPRAKPLPAFYDSSAAPTLETTDHEFHVQYFSLSGKIAISSCPYEMQNTYFQCDPRLSAKWGVKLHRSRGATRVLESHSNSEACCGRWSVF